LSLKAIGGNVFIKPDVMDSEVGDIAISGGAQVRSSYGEIVAIDGRCEFASVGDRVHIPHYAVEDIEYDGEKYAICKASRLFLVNGKPVNGYVRVRKCENDHVRDDSGEIALYMTEKHIEWTNWVEVVEAIEGSEFENYIGMFCVAPENDQKLCRIGRSKDFCLHTELIKFVTEG
jgi:co-chaperonin GroES (HSP10)